MLTKTLLTPFLLAALASTLQAKDDKLADKIQNADQSRMFLTDKCISSHIKIDTTTVNEYDAKISGDNTLVFQTFPSNRKDTMMVMNMLKTWKVSKGSKRPVIMDAGQRMNGLASVGDLVGTRFYRDFTPKDMGPVKDEETKKEMRKISLSAKSNDVLYAQIDIFLDEKSGLVDKADVLSADLKTVLKKIEYKYENTFDVDGKKLPMLSFMKIHRGEAGGNFVDNVTFSELKACQTKPKHLDLKIVMLKHRGVVIK